MRVKVNMNIETIFEMSIHVIGKSTIQTSRPYHLVDHIRIDLLGVIFWLFIYMSFY